MSDLHRMIDGLAAAVPWLKWSKALLCFTYPECAPKGTLGLENHTQMPDFATRRALARSLGVLTLDLWPAQDAKLRERLRKEEEELAVAMAVSVSEAEAAAAVLAEPISMEDAEAIAAAQVKTEDRRRTICFSNDREADSRAATSRLWLARPISMDDDDAAAQV